MEGRSLTLADARVVTPGGVHEGWLTIEDGRITHVGHGSAPGPGHSLAGRYVVPGFVDIHNHGGAGGSFPTGDPDEASRSVALHARHGCASPPRRSSPGCSRPGGGTYE